MKNILTAAAFITLFHTSGVGQTLNQITILPANPTSADSICIITDFTYYGSCTYGLVGVYTSSSDTSLHIAPTYCGYGSDTLCNSIDTFKIGPFASGSYAMHIEFHQGSVCPFSGFDALLHVVDTVLIVGTTGTSLLTKDSNSQFSIFPNPAREHLIIKSTIANPPEIYRIRITDILGRLRFESLMTGDPLSLDISNWDTAMYFIAITTESGNFVHVQSVVVE